MSKRILILTLAAAIGFGILLFNIQGASGSAMMPGDDIRYHVLSDEDVSDMLFACGMDPDCTKFVHENGDIELYISGIFSWLFRRGSQAYTGYEVGREGKRLYDSYKERKYQRERQEYLDYIEMLNDNPGSLDTNRHMCTSRHCG